ncbi:MAG: SPFH domain-containing protein [Candidatus Aminicenantes bacterium]|nr:SPFH domain-containing protein [Candidatus Aminicenantes bacterium]
MKFVSNPVQVFVRNFFRWGIAIPLWYFIVWPIFRGSAADLQSPLYNPPEPGQIALGVILTVLILWFANTIAKMFNILPQWERLVLLRLGKSVGVRGPGFFLIPPFIYSIASIVDVRISTYEVKATRTLTKDNIPIDVIAAVELEIENPEKAVIGVKDYWKTTEWASMEALKSSIGKNDLRPLLSDTENIAVSVKAEIDEAAKDFGVNVRAVRITDISAPPSLIEELAVIARAERSAKAKLIEAEAEKAVAQNLAEAAQTLSTQPGTMELRQIQALLEISKEESSTIIIYPMDSFSGGRIAAAVAGTQSTSKGNAGPVTVAE